MLKTLLYIALLLRSLCADSAQPAILPITPDIAAEMIAGGSYHEGCPVPLAKLRYLRIRYHDLQDRTKEGALIVHEDVAAEAAEIFEVLYREGFPIAGMEPVSHFKGDDEASMRADNTSAFNCRYIAGTKKFSKHSYGKAIDINPLLNPCVQKTTFSPTNAAAYLNRHRKLPGMIHKDDFIVHLFQKHGWKWGGNWHSLKDYQHFEK